MTEIRTDRVVPVSAIKKLWDTCPATAGRDPESIDLAWQSSAYVVHAWRGDALIGTARVISDRSFFAAICDVVCTPGSPSHMPKDLAARAAEPFARRGMKVVMLTTGKIRP